MSKLRGAFSMSSIRSAPGFMNIYELIYILGNGLSAPAITKIDKAKVNNSEFHTAGFSGNITDDYNVYSIFDVVYPNSLEYLIEKKQYPLHLKLLHLKVAIRNTCESNSRDSGECINAS
jgi:hypothetical protein